MQTNHRCLVKVPGSKIPIILTGRDVPRFRHWFTTQTDLRVQFVKTSCGHTFDFHNLGYSREDLWYKIKCDKV